MVQNAGYVLKNSQNKRSERLEIVDIYLPFNLYLRWNGVKFRAVS